MGCWGVGCGEGLLVRVLAGVAPPEWIGILLSYTTIGMVMVYFLSGIVLLFRGYRLMPDTPERRPVTVILIGSILSGLVMLYLAVLQTARPVSMNARTSSSPCRWPTHGYANADLIRCRKSRVM